jgi:predicted Zn-dependent peptidase
MVLYGLDYLQVVDAAVKQLRSGTLSSTDIAHGKTQLKAAILYNQESNSTLAEEIGTQAVLLGSVLSGPAVVSALNSVTDAEVNAVSFYLY